jgi:hypothetical protein
MGFALVFQSQPHQQMSGCVDLHIKVKELNKLRTLNKNGK